MGEKALWLIDLCGGEGSVGEMALWAEMISEKSRISFSKHSVIRSLRSMLRFGCLAASETMHVAMSCVSPVSSISSMSCGIPVDANFAAIKPGETAAGSRCSPNS